MDLLAASSFKTNASVTNAVVATAVVLFPTPCVTAIVPVGKVGVPVNVGDSDNTVFPVPVEEFTPVPPFRTGKIPVTFVVRSISPASLSFVIAPLVTDVAFPTLVIGPVRFALVKFSLITNAVVATPVVLFPAVCVTAIVPVGKLGAPVNVGDSKFAFKTKASKTAF